MLSQVTATRFVQRMGNGRTFPCLIECEDDAGNSVELVVKYSKKLMEGEKSLVFEAIAAMLAADLDLPVPEPFVVSLEAEFIALISDLEVRAAMEESCVLGFGSRHVTQYAVWPNGQTIPKAMTQLAAEIAVFDQIVINNDRRPANPNCMFLADQLVIFDHELAFTKLLFWKEPWNDSGMSGLDTREHHIFAGPYFESHPTEFNRFIQAWEAITDERIDSYHKALPQLWVYDEIHINETLSYLKQVKSNIRAITENALKVLR